MKAKIPFEKGLIHQNVTFSDLDCVLWWLGTNIPGPRNMATFYVPCNYGLNKYFSSTNTQNGAYPSWTGGSCYPWESCQRGDWLLAELMVDDVDDKGILILIFLQVLFMTLNIDEDTVATQWSKSFDTPKYLLIFLMIDNIKKECMHWHFYKTKIWIYCWNFRYSGRVFRVSRWWWSHVKDIWSCS